MTFTLPEAWGQRPHFTPANAAAAGRTGALARNASRGSSPSRLPGPLRPCCHCGRKVRVLQRGRCKTDYHYLRAHGHDRPPHLLRAQARREGRAPWACIRCNVPLSVGGFRQERCNACWRWLLRYGAERPRFERGGR